jgi:NADH dehydrogenase
MEDEISITLVDRHARFVFSPLLIDGLAGILKEHQYSEDYQTIAGRDGFTFVQAEGLDVDRTVKHLHVRMSNGDLKALSYDILVLTPGARVAYYGIDGAEQNTYPLKSLEDVTRIHAALKELDGRKKLALTIVGGGPSGIEALFAVKRYMQQELGVEPKRVAYTLLNAGPEILAGFRPTLVHGSRKAIERQGISILNGDPAISVSADRIKTKSGKEIKTDFVLWCAGVQPNDLSVSPDVTRDARRCMETDNTLRLAEDVFGGGDATICYIEVGKPAPRTAQIAMMQAAHLAKNVERVLAGEKPKPFRSDLKGSIITLGDTGYIETPWFAFKTALAVPLRRFFYRIRFKQMTGRW